MRINSQNLMAFLNQFNFEYMPRTSLKKIQKKKHHLIWQICLLEFVEDVSVVGGNHSVRKKNCA